MRCSDVRTWGVRTSGARGASRVQVRARAAARRRWRATRSRLPHISLEHQRRRRPREVSRYTRGQVSPSQRRSPARAAGSVSRSTASRARAASSAVQVGGVRSVRTRVPSGARSACGAGRRARVGVEVGEGGVLGGGAAGAEVCLDQQGRAVAQFTERGQPGGVDVGEGRAGRDEGRGGDPVAQGGGGEEVFRGVRGGEEVEAGAAGVEAGGPGAGAGGGREHVGSPPWRAGVRRSFYSARPGTAREPLGGGRESASRPPCPSRSVLSRPVSYGAQSLGVSRDRR